MATRHSSLPEQTPSKLNQAERRLWIAAFCAAELPVLLKGNGRRIAASGLAHLTAEYADAAVTEYRRRFNSR